VGYAHPAVAVTCRLYRNGAVTEERITPDRVSNLLEEPDAVVWLDLEDPSEEDLRMLQEEFGLHPLAVEDTLHRDQRSKVEAYEDHFFLVVHALGLEGDEMRDSEIHVFAGHGFLVTLRYAPLFDMATVRRRWDKQPDLAKEGGGALLYTLLDEVVDDYFDVVERLEDESEEIESQVFADEPVPDLQERIFALKKRVLQFRRRVLPLREVLDLVGEEAGLVTDRLRPYYRDVADHVLRVLEFIDNVRELATTALEAHLSQVSNRLNQVMKQLTAWAAIILVPTLIAGIYGMNFIRPFPDFDNPWGFWIAVVLMVASAGVLYGVFRRRGWI
jgi:magnesium transporter